ncbi:UDP-4-amino-4-deoxy-L-arabinose--oxoglutarate aminotransferase [Actinomyces bovis]|uniref:UDP-4-amino-4-deoxy-L-arabinose--oxoglutarate aminotransferase n=1 Tax=Actinomyces bovis TaxID=1658 RepID=A0ABY1VP44_9ACTO|nr:DegT/DnrJ/EryC1/StrS family aminotransferase [Actinomyces bovis]SPT53750.1 UDP-4-amino-4-deoxy-L-arabinose--oxoglutarate aminotransferase [Actinomyces bovis]VEG53071.1 UDP-4-amino-4-deoxy-L-arabinose--oxoglutarate aminotransferase [Actinomyces israelii]
MPTGRLIPFSPPALTEEDIAAVSAVLRSGWITTGPKTKEFEQLICQWAGAARAACLNSATAALEIALRLLGIGAGDEVIVPAYTYTASVSPVVHLGATPVMIDANEDDYGINLAAVRAAVTERTKAIIAVDIAGRMCDYPKLLAIVNEMKECFVANSDRQAALGRIAVIADGAHSFGAMKYGIKSGAAADFTTFSFHAVKNLTTGEGGALTWKCGLPFDDDELYQEIMLLSLHGQNKDALAKSEMGSWEYDVSRIGYKCNMTDIAAALGVSQCKRYGAVLKRRQDVVRKYDRLLTGTMVNSLDHFAEGSFSSCHLYLVRVESASLKQRNAIIEAMAEQGVVCNVHYKPLPLMSGYRRLGFSIDSFPNALKLYENALSLPLHNLLSDDDIEYVASALYSAIQEGAGR